MSQPMQFRAARALVIGVGDYLHPRLANLPATTRDAQALAGVLSDPLQGGYPQGTVTQLIGEQASLENMRKALRDLAQQATFEMTVVIFFSGHGAQTTIKGQHSAFLCPREADLRDLPQTALAATEFSNLLSAIRANKVLVLIDACHAAGAADFKAAAPDANVVQTGLPEAYYTDLSQQTGRVIIASSRENQLSYVRGEMSLFTSLLVQALKGEAAIRGDNLVHVLDIFHYLSEEVPKVEAKQTPILKVKNLDLNFPVALAPFGQRGQIRPSAGPKGLEALRDELVYNPIMGAKALSAYVATRPDLAAKRSEIDLRRAQLLEIQQNEDLFGAITNDEKVAKARAVVGLLRILLALERGPEEL